MYNVYALESICQLRLNILWRRPDHDSFFNLWNIRIREGNFNCNLCLVLHTNQECIATTDRGTCIFLMHGYEGRSLDLDDLHGSYEKVSKEKSVERLEQGRNNNCWLKLWRYFRKHGYTSE